MGITQSKAEDSAPPAMPNFVQGSSPVMQAAIEELKETVRGA